jgi:four helix bundle protein
MDANAAVHASVSEPLASHPAAGGETAAPAPALDAEKLVCYDLALELQVLCGTLAPPSHRAIQDQLERASLSVVCNIAEGAGRRSRKDKRRIYAMARGSAAETAAIVDVLRLRRLAPEGPCRSARTLAVRVIQLLTKLDKALA